MLDRKTLVKLLELSTSPVDAEALGAIRKCNAMLKENRITWTMLFTARAPGTPRPTPKWIDDPVTELERFFDLLAEQEPPRRRKR
jgi:hypothetical protein